MLCLVTEFLNTFFKSVRFNAYYTLPYSLQQFAYNKYQVILNIYFYFMISLCFYAFVQIVRYYIVSDFIIIKFYQY